MSEGKSLEEFKKEIDGVRTLLLSQEETVQSAQSAYLEAIEASHKTLKQLSQMKDMASQAIMDHLTKQIHTQNAKIASLETPVEEIIEVRKDNVET